MLEHFIKVKEYKKSTRYESEDYVATVKFGGYAFAPKRFYDIGEERDLLPFYELTVMNKKTKRKAQTRVFCQNAIEALDRDYVIREQFKDVIWNKIH